MRPDLRGHRAGDGSLKIASARVDHPDAARMLAERLAEWEATYGYGDPPDADPTDYVPPRGLFLIVYARPGDPIACGGYRAVDLTQGVVEVGKMYVDPGWRRQGVGRLLLDQLEVHARKFGGRVSTLETGIRNVAAQELYAANGYRPIDSSAVGRPRMTKQL